MSSSSIEHGGPSRLIIVFNVGRKRVGGKKCVLTATNLFTTIRALALYHCSTTVSDHVWMTIGTQEPMSTLIVHFISCHNSDHICHDSSLLFFSCLDYSTLHLFDSSQVLFDNILISVTLNYVLGTVWTSFVLYRSSILVRGLCSHVTVYAIQTKLMTT